MRIRNHCLPLALLATLAIPTAAQEPNDPATRMRAADQNGDGIVTREEFVANRSARFPDLDVDESGGLSEDEFKVALEGTRMKRFSGMAFGRADADDDDRISQSEWDAMPARAFDRLDDNEDGQLDTSELRR